MFKPRHFQIKLVKDQPETTETVVTPTTSYDIERIAHIVIRKVVIGTIVTVASAVALTTLSQITVNACDNHNKDNN